MLAESAVPAAYHSEDDTDRGQHSILQMVRAQAQGSTIQPCDTFIMVLQGAWRGAPCAVKFMVCDTADEKALQRATREIVLSKRMSHPNVVCSTIRNCPSGLIATVCGLWCSALRSFG